MRRSQMASRILHGPNPRPMENEKRARMANSNGFLEAIRAAPDDDGPRLVYADWLEERGDPRGEFIRIQCVLEHIADDAPERPDLEAREQELRAAHADTWTEPWRDW